MKEIKILPVTFALTAVLFTSGQKFFEAKKQNIILILADDMSYFDLSCLGQKKFKTPNIDKLYNDGLFFSQAYCGAPECTPSRCTLMQGKHLGHSRIRLNNSVRGQDHLIDQDITIAEMLKKGGYNTGFVGKWGMGLPRTEGTPEKQGFDYSYGYTDQLTAHGYYPNYLYENGKPVSFPENYGFNMAKVYKHTSSKEGLNIYNENGELIPDGVKDPAKAKNSQNLIHEKALHFIRDNQKSPFFLYYATQLPHGPLITPNLGEFKDEPWELKNKEWAAMMTHLDRHIGELIDLTVELGIEKNTIFLFASDNGYSHWGYMNRARYEDDPVFKNKGPWKGGKFSSFDGGMRVPLIAYCPGKIPHNTTAHPVVLYDLFATACDIAGVKSPENDGISIVPLLMGKPEKQKNHAFFYWGGGTFMPQAQAVRLGDWFGMRASINEPVQLWNLQKDLKCERNVAGENPSIIREILHIMEKEHEDSEWYENPGDSASDIKAKKEKAQKNNTMQNDIGPNTQFQENIVN